MNMKPVSYHLRRVIDLHSFLDRFEDVRETGEGGGKIQYEAKCPAHDTKHRSLAIAATRDGRYLVHCHAGCSASDVLAAVGLELSDLYPDGCMQESIKPRQRSQKARQDDFTTRIAQWDRESGKRLSEADKRAERNAWLAQKRRGPFA